MKRIYSPDKIYQQQEYISGSNPVPYNKLIHLAWIR